MGKLNQPHDKYFKATFGKVDFAKDFLNNYLPEELVDIIDMDTLESQPTSYISKELKEQFTDLLFRVNILEREAYIFFLFEHKSYRDRMVIFQVLKYMIAIWEAKIEEDLEKRKEENLLDTEDIEIPIVIPLVIYHNKDKWNIKRTLGEMMPGFMDFPDSLKKYIPDFEYMLSDLSDLEKDPGIELDEDHSIVVRTLNKARYITKDQIIEMFIEAITLFTKTNDRDMVDHYITESLIYILAVREDVDERELAKIAGQISEEGGELVMTAAERLKREGRQEGMEIGALKKAREMAKYMIIDGQPIDKIIKYTKLTMEQIEEVKEEMLN